MKNYNKILEAVNRGIKFALSDLEDNEELSSISKLKTGLIINNNSTKGLLELKKEVVDLGLPSGTLWCKYNLGVDHNQLTKPEDWYGDYYAWGELKPNKYEFSWFTYKYAEHYTDLSEKDCLTKYCNIPQKGYNQITKTWGFTDNLTLLLPEDDVAFLTKKFHNYKFHIPTKELCEELINYTNNYWVNNYDPNKLVHNHEDDGGIKELNGRVFIGLNGNQLFIPAAGYYSSDNILPIGYVCAVWSSSLFLSRPDNAYYLYINLNFIDTWYDIRFDGCSVRPVINL